MKKWTRWTDEMSEFLRSNYGSIGDTKLAEIFEQKFPKHFKWTKKQIEKRRSYMGLKRTKEQEHRLRCINNGDGRQYKMWDTRGRMKEGEVRDWGGRKYIMVGGSPTLLHRYVYGAKDGDVVRRHEGVVEIISRSENQRRNTIIRHAQPEEIKETISALNKLKGLLRNGK